MTTTPTLAVLLDAHKAASGISDAELARRIGVTRQAVHLWRTTGLRGLPSREHMRALATTCGVSYEQVLDVALRETGYLDAGEIVVMPVDVRDFLLIATAEYQGRQAQLWHRRDGRGVPVIEQDRTARVLAWLWRAQPDRAVVFIADYCHGLNTNPDDAQGHIGFSVDEVIDGMRISLSGSRLTSEEFEELSIEARRRVKDLV